MAGRRARSEAIASSNISSVSPRINQVLGAKEDMEDEDMPELAGSSDTEEDAAMRKGWLMQEEEEDEEDDDEDDEEAMFKGIEGDAERLKAEKEDKFIRKVLDLKAPSEQEVKDHWLRGHWPYRNWCPVCVAARGKEMDHRDAASQRSLPEYAFG